LLLERMQLTGAILSTTEAKKVHLEARRCGELEGEIEYTDAQALGVLGTSLRHKQDGRIWPSLASGSLPLALAVPPA